MGKEGSFFRKAREGKGCAGKRALFGRRGGRGERDFVEGGGWGGGGRVFFYFFLFLSDWERVGLREMLNLGSNSRVKTNLITDVLCLNYILKINQYNIICIFN